MTVVIEQSPGKAVCVGLFKQGREAINKHETIIVVEKDSPSLNPTYDYMLKQSQDIYSGLSWHGTNSIRNIALKQ